MICEADHLLFTYNFFVALLLHLLKDGIKIVQITIKYIEVLALARFLGSGDRLIICDPCKQSPKILESDLGDFAGCCCFGARLF